MISADHDVFVSKSYREMPKMVGMMGSWTSLPLVLLKKFQKNTFQFNNFAFL
jgi:hypothetical protein